MAIGPSANGIKAQSEAFQLDLNRPVKGSPVPCTLNFSYNRDTSTDQVVGAISDISGVEAPIIMKKDNSTFGLNFVWEPINHTPFILKLPSGILVAKKIVIHASPGRSAYMEQHNELAAETAVISTE